MRLVKCSIVLALLIVLDFAPRFVFAQAGPVSDVLSEDVGGPSGPVPMTPPFPPAVIPEGPETANPFFIPSRVIDFLEPTGGISDRLTIGPVGGQFRVDVLSDSDPASLLPRQGATLIPASALEHFQPIHIEAFSDGDLAGTGGTSESDTLRVILGYYGPGTGFVVFDGAIPEPLSESDPELPMVVTIPPMHFDVEEPSPTGGSTGIISDQVDIIQPFDVTFLSSDNPTDYDTIPPSGTITEDAQFGGGVIYAIDFVSDTDVPEPASFALLGVALLAATLFGQRRRIM